MAEYMLGWTREGKLPVSALHEAFRFLYSLQDPVTGLWGTARQPRNVRINGTFKLFALLRDRLDLPLRHANRILDQVLDELQMSDYETRASGCDEFDNWYMTALALDPSGGHQEEEIWHLAARHIPRVRERYRTPDGGFSYTPSRCATHWCEVDMAPPLPQGDAVSVLTLVHSLTICADLAGLAQECPWPVMWRMHQPDPQERKLVLAGLS